MATWTFYKRATAPAGTINYTFNGHAFTINDTTATSITTTDPIAAGEFSALSYLTTNAAAATPTGIAVVASGINPFIANNAYNAGDECVNGGQAYAAVVSFTSGAIFNAPDWRLLSDGSRYDKDNGQAGLYLLPPLMVPISAGLQMAAQMVRGVRFRPSRTTSIIKGEIVIITPAAGNDTYELAIYQDAGLNNPITRVATTGITSGQMNTSTQVHPINVTYAAQAGVTYYCVLSYSQLVGATAAKLAAIGSVDGAIYQTQIMGPRFPVAEIFQADAIVAAGTALPSTLTYTATAIAPLLVLRET